MRRRLTLPFIALLFAATPFTQLMAQQIEPGEINYYVLSAVFAAGAGIAYAVDRNIASCPNGEYNTPQTNSPQIAGPEPDGNCNTRENVKVGVEVVGIGCAIGAVVSFIRAVRGEKLVTSGLINVSPGTRGALRVPDVAYSAPRRDLRVLIVHAAF